MHPELSNVSTANTSTLAEAKRIRQQIQRDAQLLENRLKLLHKEEERVLKRIEDTQKHTQKVNEAYDRHAHKLKAQADLRQVQSQRMQAAKANITRLKTERSKDKQQRYNAMMKSKLQAVQEVRDMKADGGEFKSYCTEQLTLDNLRRTSSVKHELAQASERVSAFQQRRIKEARENYTDKIEEEDRQKQATEQRLLSMEALEMELIARLQNTQMVQQRAYTELEKALNRSRQTSTRSEKITPG
jgi:hypothetical protein